MKLGKLAAEHDPRTLMLADFVTGPLVAPPMRDWDAGLPDDTGAMNNLTVGCCAVAAIAHLIQEWTFNTTGIAITISDADVLVAYSAITGYNPADPSTDRGAVMLNVLRWVRANGLGPQQHGKGLAFVKIANDIDHARIVLNLGGGIYVGAQLPASASAQIGSLWTLPATGLWGGHAFAAVRADRAGGVCRTWGKRQSFDWPFYLSTVDEAYMIIAADWVTGDRPAPNGFDITALRSALVALG